METLNPFASDEFKKALMESEGLGEGSSDIEEVVPENLEFQDIIKSTPKIPKGVKNVILDASALAKNEKEAKATELNLALSDVLSRYNKEYGTDLQIDFSNMSRTMVVVSDPKSRRILELYLSEIFQSIRPVLILQMISKLTLAVDYILDPERMFGGELQLTDIWISIEKIMQYIQQLEAMKDEILIKGAPIELKKMGSEADNHEIGDLDQNEVVQDFMKMFKRDNGLGQ